MMPNTGRTSAETQARTLEALKLLQARGVAYPKAEALAMWACLHVRTVYRALDDLEAAGRIRRVERIEVLR